MAMLLMKRRKSNMFSSINFIIFSIYEFDNDIILAFRIAILILKNPTGSQSVSNPKLDRKSKSFFLQ